MLKVGIKAQVKQAESVLELLVLVNIPLDLLSETSSLHRHVPS